MVPNDLTLSRERARNWPFHQWYRLAPLKRTNLLDSLQTFIQLSKLDGVEPDFDVYIDRINDSAWPLSNLNDVKTSLQWIQDYHGKSQAYAFLDRIAPILPKPKTWADIEATLYCIVQMPTPSRRYAAVDNMVHGEFRRLMNLPPKFSLNVISSIFCDLVDLKSNGAIDLSTRWQQHLFFSTYQNLYNRSFFTDSEHHRFSSYVQEHAKTMTWKKEGHAIYYWPYVDLFNIDPFKTPYFHASMLDMSTSQATSLFERFREQHNHEGLLKLSEFVVQHAHFSSGIHDNLYWPCLDTLKNKISELNNDLRRKILLGCSFREAYLQGLVAYGHGFFSLDYTNFMTLDKYEESIQSWKYDATFKHIRLHASPVNLAMQKLSDIDLSSVGSFLDINLNAYEPSTFLSEIEMYHGILSSIQTVELPDNIDIDMSSLI